MYSRSCCSTSLQINSVMTFPIYNLYLFLCLWAVRAGAVVSTMAFASLLMILAGHPNEMKIRFHGSSVLETPRQCWGRPFRPLIALSKIILHLSRFTPAHHTPEHPPKNYTSVSHNPSCNKSAPIH